MEPIGIVYTYVIATFRLDVCRFVGCNYLIEVGLFWGNMHLSFEITYGYVLMNIFHSTRFVYRYRTSTMHILHSHLWKRVPHT